MSGSQIRIRDGEGTRFEFEDGDALREWIRERPDVEALEVQLADGGPWVSLMPHLDQEDDAEASNTGVSLGGAGSAASALDNSATLNVLLPDIDLDAANVPQSNSVTADPDQTAQVILPDIGSQSEILSTQTGSPSAEGKKIPPPLPPSSPDDSVDAVITPSLLNTQGYRSTPAEDAISEAGGPRDTEEYPHPIKSLPIPAAPPRASDSDPLGPLIQAGQEVSSIDVIADESFDSFDDVDDGLVVEALQSQSPPEIPVPNDVVIYQPEDELDASAELESADLLPAESLDEPEHALEDRPTDQSQLEDRPTLERPMVDRPTVPKEAPAVIIDPPTLRYEGRADAMASREPAFIRSGESRLGVKAGSEPSNTGASPISSVESSQITLQKTPPVGPQEKVPTTKYPKVQSAVPIQGSARSTNWYIWVLVLLVGADLTHRLLSDEAVKQPTSVTTVPVEKVDTSSSEDAFDIVSVDGLADAHRLMALGEETKLGEAAAVLSNLLQASAIPSKALTARVNAALAEIALLRAERLRVFGQDPKSNLVIASESISKSKSAEALAVIQYLEAEHARISGDMAGLKAKIESARTSGRSPWELRRLESALAIDAGESPEQFVAALELLDSQPGGPIATALYKAEIYEMAGKFSESIATLEAVEQLHPSLKGVKEWIARVEGKKKKSEAKSSLSKSTSKEKPQTSPKASDMTIKPEGSFDSLMAEGSRLLERGRARQAKDYFSAASQLKPNAAAAISNLGWCALELKDNKGAKKFFSRSLRITPSFEDGLYGLGIALQKLGDTNAARETYRKYLDAHPGGSKATMVRRRLDKLSGGR